MTTEAVTTGKNSQDAVRKCIATGELRPKSELLRFVIGPEQVLAFDVAGKLPGRGIWVSATKDALTLTTKKNLFSRSAKTQVFLPEGLEQWVETALVKRVVSLLGLARKSGGAVTGSTKVKDWATSERASILFQASDGSPREKSKIRLWGDGKTFECLTRQELGAAFGREFAVHAALDAGGLASRVIEEATRLEGFRPAAPDGRMKG
ncbi:RNA-binding protein [Lentibacter sp. XHP0401]|uniref:RNA-binding protein n=1 Tax=Lentibacter sp. XHP0401 TaxID=2984334 RepID=UPI0021E7BC7B|nr:RNA-binding protein [Lentibacter sp. XHP0401]MCV2892540.1 RNA-binding protein [Lentibacter sp. XHP0401]